MLRPARPPPLALLPLFLALAAGVGPGGGGAGVVMPPPGGGGPPLGNGTASTTSASRPAVKDLGFGYGRGGLESVLAAVFNKVAKGTTAAPMTTRPPPAAPTTTAPTTTHRPTTTSTARPASSPPPPTEMIPLPPPPMPPLGPAGAVPTRRAPHPLPDYAPPNRPPPLPAEYNPFANKAILRGSQSEVGSAGPGRKPHPQLLPPRPPMDELIPLRPVNTPSQGGGGGGGVGSVPKGDPPSVASIPDAPRPERPPERPGSSGHSGKHHLDSHVHTAPASAQGPPVVEPSGAGLGVDPTTLKAAKPTELLDQVNKDSIIDVQAEVAVVADPAIHRDEDNRDKVLVAPATSPPSSVRPAGHGPVGVGASSGDWHVAWTAQVYGLGTMWGVLAVLCLLAAIWVNSRTRLLPRVHFMMLLALLLALAAANSVSLFYDVLNESQRDQLHYRAAHAGPVVGVSEADKQDEERGDGDARDAGLGGHGAARVPQLLADLTLPFLPAAFSVFFFVVLRVNHVPCGSSGVPQTPVFLALLFLFLATSMSLEVASCAVGAVAAGGGAVGMRSAARGLTVCVAALLGLSYLAVYRPLRRAAAKKQAEQVRAAYTAFRRLPAPALPRVVNALLACAVLLVSLAAMASYRLVDATVIGSNADWRAPPWWYLRLAEHAGSLLVGFLLLWSATRGPSRGSDERSSASSRGSRGTPGALSLVSCTGRRFLFDCPSTGSEENKTSEDNTYPAVCASNHAILNYTQHTGNKLYDDSFPLANLHSAPLNSSGDDFCNVPTMPKRSAVKSGTLLPYSKASSRRAGAPGGPGGPGGGVAAGHHTLGPGGQLYDAQPLSDTLRRGTRTTGRTRKARHAGHAAHAAHAAHGSHATLGGHAKMYSNCPQDDDDYDQRLDGLADDFQVFKQYSTTGHASTASSSKSSESADNYDVPMLVSAPSGDGHKRHRRQRAADENRSLHHHRKAAARHAAADSLSPASPSDLSDCDRLSSNRSSYDEAAPVVRGHAHQQHHHQQRGRAAKQGALLFDASEDDVTPDSAVVADMSTSSHHSHHSPREKRAVKRPGRRQHSQQSQHEAHSPSSPSRPSGSPELLRQYSDNAWPPQ